MKNREGNKYRCSYFTGEIIMISKLKIMLQVFPFLLNRKFASRSDTVTAFTLKLK